MATTPAGTSYTPTVHVNAMGDNNTYCLADAEVSTSTVKPVFLFCHGAGSADNFFAASESVKGLRDRLIDHGWFVVEGDGWSPTHWGRPEAGESYAATLTELAELFPLGPVTIMGRSMGGLVSSALATQDRYGIKPHVAGLMVNAGVQSLVWWGVTEGKTFSGAWPDPAIDLEAFMEATEDFDPLRWDPSVYAGLPVQWISGTHDTSVDFTANGLAQYNRVKQYAAHVEYHLKGLGTHDVNGDLSALAFNWDAQWDFARRSQGLHLDGGTSLDIVGEGSVNSHRALYRTPPWRQALPLSQ